MRNIKRDHPEGFDGYLLLDADNLLRTDYVEKMSDALSAGNEIVTSYRNSKNFGDSWVSAGSSLCFLRECRNLQQARSILGLSCVSSGTGYLFSRTVAEEFTGWPYRTLTEDIEFTLDQILKGRKIAYCAQAEFFDEQPATFRQSWDQRVRWSKGYLQNFRLYFGALMKGMLKGSFICYDMLTVLLPVNLIAIVGLPVNLLIMVYGIWSGQSTVIQLLISFLRFFGTLYLSIMFYAAVITIAERKRIWAGRWKRFINVLTTPVFVLTYLPVSLVAAMAPVTWKPIAHKVSMQEMQRRSREERLPI